MLAIALAVIAILYPSAYSTLYTLVSRTEFSRVNKRLKDKDGRPIVIAADNPILDTNMYKFEYADGYKTSMIANAISSNLFLQVNQDGQRFVLLNAIIESRTYGTQIKEGESLIHIYNVNKRRRETTKVWEV